MVPIKMIGHCFFFRLTYVRVPDILYFIISGRVNIISNIQAFIENLLHLAICFPQ